MPLKRVLYRGLAYYLAPQAQEHFDQRILGLALLNRPIWIPVGGRGVMVARSTPERRSHPQGPLNTDGEWKIDTLPYR
jgi:hypothetical protein